MHAALMYLQISHDRAPEAAKAFTDHVLPSVKRAKGFLRGYWLDSVDEQGFGFVLFQTEGDAEAALERKVVWEAPGVTILRFQIRRVAVEAT
jgi:hypothetical protein